MEVLKVLKFWNLAPIIFCYALGLALLVVMIPAAIAFQVLSVLYQVGWDSIMGEWRLLGVRLALINKIENSRRVHLHHLGAKVEAQIKKDVLTLPDDEQIDLTYLVKLKVFKHSNEVEVEAVPYCQPSAPKL